MWQHIAFAYYLNKMFEYSQKGVLVIDKIFNEVKDNERVFESEKYIINGYIGKNGKITQEEFEKIGENFA